MLNAAMSDGSKRPSGALAAAEVRRVISIGSIATALVVLVVILSTATLVDRRPPSVERVSLSAPAGGERTAQTISAIDVEFSEPVDHGSVERRLRIEPFVAGAITWDGSTAIFTPSGRLPAATRFSVTVEPGYVDLAGNVATTGLEPWLFTTVGQPAVISSAPADGATGLPVDGVVTIRFDRLMDTRAVESAVRVDPPATPRFSWSGDRLTVAFESALRFGTTYTVTIGSRAADTAGNPLPGPFALRFTTVSAGLGVSATAPTDGVPGVSVRSPIAVLFDAPIDPRTVAGALRLTPSVGGETRVVAKPDDSGPPAAGDAAAEGSVLLFTPSGQLAPHTTYTVTLAPVVARADDPLRVAAGRTWSFTTGAPSVSAQNQVAFLSTRSGARNVWLMNPDGSNPRQLTSELAPVTGFDASGDGAWIAYAAGGATWVMRIDGSDRRRLTGAGVYEYAPQVTPDGRWVLVGRRSTAGADLGYWLVPISIITGPERQVLTSGAPPLGSIGLAGDGAVGGDGVSTWAGRTAFDPTGRFALIVAGSGDAVLADLQEGGRPTTGTATGLVADGSPVWVAGRSRFALIAREVGRQGTAVWTVEPGGRPEAGPAAVGTLAVAPDGSLAAVVRVGGGPARLAVLRAGETTTPSPLTEASSLDDRWPVFSPDGATILFSRVGPGAISAGIWTIARSGSGLAQLTTDGAEARWLP